MMVWGLALSGVQGQSPWSGEQIPAEAESVVAIMCRISAKIFGVC